jgi:hypothetical protein
MTASLNKIEIMLDYEDGEINVTFACRDLPFLKLSDKVSRTIPHELWDQFLNGREKLPTESGRTIVEATSDSLSTEFYM